MTARQLQENGSGAGWLRESAPGFGWKTGHNAVIPFLRVVIFLALTLAGFTRIVAQVGPPQDTERPYRHLRHLLSDFDPVTQSDYVELRSGRQDREENVARARYRMSLSVPAATARGDGTAAILRALSADFGWDSEAEDLRLISLTESPGGTHVTLQQTLGGVPVHGREVKINFNHQGEVTIVVSGYSPRLASFAGSFVPRAGVTAADADRAIRNALEDSVALVSDLEIAVLDDEPPLLVWKGLVYPSRASAEWLVFVDAVSGEIVRIVDQTVSHRDGHTHDASKRHYRNANPVWSAARQRSASSALSITVDGSGYVFDPDPLTSAGVPYGPPYSDEEDADTEELNAQRKAVTLRDITLHDDGRYRLQGPYVSITGEIQTMAGGLHFEPPAEADAGGFFYTRSDDRFEAVNVYYHLDKSQRYIQSLGFTDVQNGPISANPHDGAHDNSQYFPGANFLSFGDGGIDDAEDADVIWHEYGHAVLEAGSPGLRGNPEGKSLHEGWADYWAVSHRRELFETGQVPDGDWRRLFPWDGNNHAVSWFGRTIIAEGEFSGDIPDLYTPGVHWAGSVMEIYDVVGKEVCDRIALQSHRYLAPSTSYRDAAEALVQADIDLYDGAHTSVIVSVLGNRGYLNPEDFGPVISHLPIDDTESLSEIIPVELDVVSAIHEIASVRIVVQISGEAPVGIEALPVGGSLYVGQLRLPDKSSVIAYYVVATDAAGHEVYLPSGAPEERFEFHAGPDTIPPTLTVHPIAGASLAGWPVVVDIEAADNLGVDSVWTEFSITSGASGMQRHEGSFGLVAGSGRYAAPFPVDVSELAEGDSVFYRLYARDVSTSGNVRVVPPVDEPPFGFLIGSLEITYDFETNVGGVAAEGDWEQGTVTYGLQHAHTGEGVWATSLTGPYAETAGKSTMQLPPIDLNGFSHAYLSFWHWYDYEHNGSAKPEGSIAGILYDGGNVKISTDAGATWQVLEPVAGYPGQISGLFGNPMGGESAFGGFSYGWRRDIFELPGGYYVQLRFDSGSDDGNSEKARSYAGWVIDDVRITESVPPDTVAPVVLAAPQANAEYAASSESDNPLVVVRLSDDVGVSGVWIDYQGFAGGRNVEGTARMAMSSTDPLRFEAWPPIRGRDGFDPGDEIRFTVRATDFGDHTITLPQEPSQFYSIRYFLSERTALLRHVRSTGPWQRHTGIWDLNAFEPSSGSASLVMDLVDVPSNAERVHIALKHEYDLSTGAGGNLKVTTDGGYTWSTIQPAGDYPASMGDAGPLAGEPVFSGSTSGSTVMSTFDIRDLAGKQVQVRLDFASEHAAGESEFWRVSSVDLVVRTSTSTSFDTDLTLALHPNYPDPFAATTTIAYTLPEQMHVRLEVIDMMGRRVTTCFEGKQEPGTYTRTVDGANFATGMYLLRLATDDGQLLEKLVVVR